MALPRVFWPSVSRCCASIYRAVCVAVLLSMPLCALGQALDPLPARPIGRPFIQNFSAKAYGGHQQNWSMLQDERGIVYIGNLPGVLEYDGVHWRSIPTPNASVVRSLAMDSTGVVYVGAHAEFGYLAPDSLGLMQYRSLVEHVRPEDRTFTNVWKVHATPEGVYFRTSTHLFRWSNGQMQVWRPATEFHRSFWIRDKLYIRAWDVGLFHMQSDSLVLAPGGNQFADQRVDLMLPYEDDGILLGTRTDGLFLYERDHFERFQTDANAYLRENQLYDGIVLSDGTIALATLRGGLVHIDARGRFLQKIDKAAGLQDNTVWSVGTDRQGGVWLTLNKGIARVEIPSPISVITDEQGLESGIESLTIHEGELYAASALGVYRLASAPEAGDRPVIELLPGIATQTWSLLSTDGQLLAATSEGVFRMLPGRTEQISEEVAFSLYPSRFDEARIYVALGDGLGMLHKEGSEWVFTGRFEALTEEVRTIAESAPGMLWLGSQFHGVMQLQTRDGQLPVTGDTTTYRVVRFDETHRLPGGEVKVGLIKDRVVFDSPAGMLTFNEQAEVFEYERDIAAAYSDTTLNVRRAAEDDQGRLWVVRTREGYREFSLQPSNVSGSEPPVILPLQRIVDFGPFWSIYPDPDYAHLLWLGGDQGIVRVDTRISKQEDAPYSAWIRRVAIDRDSLIFGGMRQSRSGIALDNRVSFPAKTALRFEVAASSYDDPGSNRFQYMLEGFDEEWSPWTEETVKEFTNLPAGDYRFRVRANNLFARISEEDDFSFTLTPPWYLSWWAYVLYGVPLAFGMFMFDRFQRRRLLRKERLRSEIEQAKLKTSAAELQARTLETENELLYSKLQFLAVVDSANDAIVSAGQEGTIIFWNKRAEEIFGYTREEAVGQSLTILMPERHRASHERGLQRFLETGQERAIGSVLELEGTRKDGSEFPLSLSISSWKTEEGTFFGAIMRDITDRKQSEQALQQVQNQLAHAEKMASLGKLTAGIAHEIKNPLNFVNNFARLTVDLTDELGQILSENKEKPVNEVQDELSDALKDIKYNAKAIDKHGNRADRIIKSMMDHVREGTGAHQPTDLNELLSDAVELAYQSWLAGNSGFDVAIERSLDDSISQMNLAPQDMRRVFINLLDNALDAVSEKATASSNVYKPRILVTTKRSGNEVEIHVADNGPGIDPDVKGHIFEPFYTTKPTGSGTGLGLSLSYDIVTNGHGGNISEIGVFGEGATFVIRLSL